MRPRNLISDEEQKVKRWQDSVLAGARGSSTRERSRTPRQQPSSSSTTLHSNYVTAFHQYYRQKRCTKPFQFNNLTDKSINVSKLTQSDWNTMTFEVSTNIESKDCAFISTSDDNPDLLETLFQDAERKTEVVLRKLTTEERTQFDQAKRTELDQWMQH